MNTGTDYTISYYDGTSGTLIDLDDVQNVTIQAMKHDIKSTPFNRPSRFGFVPDGFKIEFTISRGGSTLEDLSVLNAANFNGGKIQSPGFLNKSVTNPDGSVSRYQYTNLVVFVTDHGAISREKNVVLKLEAMASECVAIA